MKTVNGIEVKEVGLDSFSRVVVRFMDKRLIKPVYVVVNKLIHSICTPFGEPGYPLPDDFQLDEESLEFFIKEYSKSTSL